MGESLQQECIGEHPQTAVKYEGRKWECHKDGEEVMGVSLYLCKFSYFSYLCIYWPCCQACRILVPNQGLNLCPRNLSGPNH